MSRQVTGAADASGRSLVPRVALFAIALLGGVGAASAACNPLMPDWQCDFKNEDSHLWQGQSGDKFRQEDNTDTLIEDAWVFIDNYYSATKTTGDAAIRGEIRTMSDAVTEALLETTAALAATAMNDPYDLKELYTDVLCDVLWNAILDRDCYATTELILKAEQSVALYEVRRAILDIELNPFVWLGEEWGGIQDDLQGVKDQWDRLESLSRNLTPDEIAPRLEAVFPDYEALMTGPRLTEARWHELNTEASAMVQATVRDTLDSAKAMGDTQAREDVAESHRISTFNEDAVGRMQAMEILNMQGVQSNQAWLKIREQSVNRGRLIALEMQDELARASAIQAENVRARLPLPAPGGGFIGPVVGDEQGSPVVHR